MNKASFLFPSALWLLSFTCFLFPFNEWPLECFTAGLLLLFGWAYTMLSRGLAQGWEMPRSPVLLFAGLFWVLVFISAFWSEVKPVSLMGICMFSLLPLTFFAGTMAGTEVYFKRIAYVLAGIFAVLSVWAMFQYFFLNAYFWGQARHPLADPSSLGALFSLALFCALGWILLDRPKSEHRFAVALATLLVCGIISTVARGPVFAFVPGIVLFGILLWPQVRRQWKSLSIVVLGGAVFFGLTLTGVQHRYNLAERVFGTVTMSGENITSNRIELWESTVHMIKDKPVLGTGIGTFFLYYPEYRNATNADTVFFAHNDPLQFWVELGILGPLLFYAFCFAAAWRSFAALKNTGAEKGGERIVVASIFAGLCAMVVQSHVSFNHYNSSILMLTGLMLSVWFMVSGRSLPQQMRSIVMPENMSGSLSRLLLAMPFLMMGWLYVSIAAGEHYTNRARDSLFQEQMFDFADDINMAGRVSMGLNFRSYLFAVNVPMSILDYKQGRLTSTEEKELYNQVTGYMQRVLGLNPRSATAYYYLAKVQTKVSPLVVPKGTPSPEEYYKKALALDPMHLGSRMELYKMYRAEKRPNEELLAILNGGIHFHYNTTVAMDYYGALAQLYLEMKDYGKAKEIMTKMAEFQKRSEFSKKRQETSIPEAIMGGENAFPRM